MKSTVRRTGSPLMPPAAIADWTRGAACRSTDTDLFFGPDHELAWQRDAREEKALAICHRCPVAATCLDAALDQGIWQWGVQGGMTADERTTERRRRLRRAGDARRRTEKDAPVPKPKPAPKPKHKPLIRVDATGSARRLQAASAVGRRIKLYARLSGLSTSYLCKVRSGAKQSVSADVARKIADAYPLVVAREEEVFPEPLGAAAVGGWAAPDAWIGVDMDDPAARPRQLEAA